MMAEPRVAVLVSVGRNPVSGLARPARNDARALALAGTLAAGPAVIHAGDPEEGALNDYLALGASAVEVVPVRPGDDAVPALAERLGGFDLILTGSRAEGGADSGMLPYLLAARLGRPVVGQALDLSVADGKATITQFLPKGRRRRVQVDLPAVVAVHPLAPAVPRYAYARRAARRVVVQPAPAGPLPPADGAWQVEPATRRPVKFKAAVKASGHSRMLSAIVTEGKGGAVLSDGTPADKARAILDYLREHRLIEF